MSARYRINNRDYYTLFEITEHFGITTEQALSRFQSESRLWAKWVDREQKQTKDEEKEIVVARYRKEPVKTVANTITDPRPKNTPWTTYDVRDRREAERKAAGGSRAVGEKRYNRRTMSIRVDNTTFSDKDKAADYLNISTQSLMMHIRKGSNPRVSVIGKTSGRVLDLTLD